MIIEEAGGQMVDLQEKPVIFDLDNPEKIYPLLAGHPDHLHKIGQLLQ